MFALCSLARAGRPPFSERDIGDLCNGFLFGAKETRALRDHYLADWFVELETAHRVIGPDDRARMLLISPLQHGSSAYYRQVRPRKPRTRLGQVPKLSFELTREREKRSRACDPRSAGSTTFLDQGSRQLLEIAHVRSLY